MKKLFYTLIFLVALSFLPILLKGQANYEETVYLKNGSIIHGIIIEQIPNQSIKIQTRDKNIFIFKIDEIEKITKEQTSGSHWKKANNNKGFGFGMKAGIDLSSWSNVDLTSEDPTVTNDKISKLGFQGGFIGNFGFNKFLSIQMELLFEQKGLKIKATNGTVTAKVWTTVTYFDIPLLVKFSYPLGPVVIYGNLGPYFGIGLSGKLATDPDVGMGGKIEFKEGGLNRFDFGLLFGGGAGFSIGNGEVFLDLRYGLGLSDINNITSKPSGYEKNCNRNFGIAVGYLIRLGK